MPISNIVNEGVDLKRTLRSTLDTVEAVAVEVNEKRRFDVIMLSSIEQHIRRRVTTTTTLKKQTILKPRRIKLAFGISDIAGRIFLYGLYVLMLLMSGGIQVVSTEAISPPTEIGLYFLEEPTSVTVPRGSPAWLNCSATSFRGSRHEADLASVTWRRNGEQVLMEDKRRQEFENGTLLVKKVTRDRDRPQGDTYECVAISDVGAIISARAVVQVADLDQFSEQPVDTRVRVGETAWLHCSISGIPTPSIRWERDKQPLLLPTDRWKTLQSGRLLEVRDARLEDTGRYRCLAENSARDRISKEALLTVLSSTDMVDESDNGSRVLTVPSHHVVAEVGTKVRLDCALEGEGLPPSAVVQWRRTDDAAPIDDVRYRLVDRGGLEIERVDLDDEGVYECSIQGSNLPSAAVDLSVTEAPRLNLSIVEEVVVQPNGRTIRLRCDPEVGGRPEPTVTWWKDSLPVTHNGRIKLGDEGRELIISPSTDTDSGLYQCWVGNGVGRVGRVVRLYIEPSGFAPLPPTNLHAEALSSRSIKLTWDPSITGQHNIVAYSVHYYPTYGGEELQQVERSLWTLIPSLRPHTNYTFYIVAYNQKSPSRHSESVTAVTLDEVPDKAPLVHCAVLNSTTIRVSWDSLSSEDARGLVTKYRVVYRRLGGAEESIREVDGNQLETLLTGLVSMETYEIQVLAGTRAGFPNPGALGRWVTVSLTDVSPSTGVDSVRNFNLRLLNGSTCLITWEEPILHGSAQLVGYKVQYRLKNTQQRQFTEVLVPDTQSYTVYNLQPESEYEFAILGLGDRGDGEVTMRTIRTPPAGGIVVPLPATLLAATPLNSTAVLLSWMDSAASPDERRRIERYSVLYRPSLADTFSSSGGSGASDGGGHTASTGNITVYRTHDQLDGLWKIAIGHLLPYTEYIFVVQGHTTRFPGMMSSEVECRTLEGVPESPRDVSAFLRSASEVQLNWLPPLRTNGRLTAYVISFTHSPGAGAWTVVKANSTATHYVLAGLEKRTTYYMRVEAENRAGLSSSSDATKIATRDEIGGSSLDDRTLGIIIGVCITVGCLIVCTLIILLKNRCRPGGRSQGHHPSHAAMATVAKGCNSRHMGHSPNQQQNLLDSTLAPPNTQLRGGGRPELGVGEDPAAIPMLNHTYCSHQSDLDTKGSDLQMDHITNLTNCNGYINRNGIICAPNLASVQQRQQHQAAAEQLKQQPAQQSELLEDEASHWQSRLDDSCTPMMLMPDHSSSTLSRKDAELGRGVDDMEDCVVMSSTVV